MQLSNAAKYANLEQGRPAIEALEECLRNGDETISAELSLYKNNLGRNCSILAEEEFDTAVNAADVEQANKILKDIVYCAELCGTPKSADEIQEYKTRAARSALMPLMDRAGELAKAGDFEGVDNGLEVLDRYLQEAKLTLTAEQKKQCEFFRIEARRVCLSKMYQVGEELASTEDKETLERHVEKILEVGAGIVDAHDLERIEALYRISAESWLSIEIQKSGKFALTCTLDEYNQFRSDLLQNLGWYSSKVSWDPVSLCAVHESVLQEQEKTVKLREVGRLLRQGGTKLQEKNLSTVEKILEQVQALDEDLNLASTPEGQIRLDIYESLKTDYGKAVLADYLRIAREDCTGDVKTCEEVLQKAIDGQKHLGVTLTNEQLEEIERIRVTVREEAVADIARARIEELDLDAIRADLEKIREVQGEYEIGVSKNVNQLLELFGHLKK